MEETNVEQILDTLWKFVKTDRDWADRIRDNTWRCCVEALVDPEKAKEIFHYYDEVRKWLEKDDISVDTNIKP